MAFQIQIFLCCAILVLVSAQKPESKPAPTPTIDYTGRYKLTSSDNLSKFLDSVGVKGAKAKAILDGWCELVIKKNQKNRDISYSLEHRSNFRNVTLNFKSDQEFEAARFFDGTKVKSDININGDSWLQTFHGDLDVTMEVKFEGAKGLAVTLTHFKAPAEGSAGKRVTVKATQRFSKQ